MPETETSQLPPVNCHGEAMLVRTTDEYAKLLLDSTPLCCRLWDRNYNLIECNEAAATLFGLKSKREYIDRYFELAPAYQPDGQPTREKAISLIERAFQEGSSQDTFLYQMPDGSPFPAESKLVRIPYGDGFVVASYFRDLREQEKMLAEIETRDKLNQTVNNAADILLRAEPEVFEDTMQMCMGMLAKAFGADRMRVIKNTVEDGQFYRSLLHEWSEHVPPMKGTVFTTKVSYLKTTPAMLETMLRREYTHSVISDMPISDQAWFKEQGVLSILMFPVFSGDTFWGMVGFDNCHDERLYTATQVSIMQSGGMILANALLRNETILRLQDASNRLEAALSDAKEANNAKDNFLAAMSHEIRTPLNAVVGLAELALADDTPENEREENLEKIHSSGMTILSIVNDILDTSKMESGRFELYPVSYSVPSLINDIVALNIVRIGDKSIIFKLYIDENLPEKLFGDDLRVKQIFNNVISNALKYTQSGMVEWHVGYERDGGSVWITSYVKDTGIGIKPEDMQKLFSDYYQVNRQSNRQVEGTGLGLAITKRLINMMDGSIEVKSDFGKGTTFFIRLRQGFVTENPIGKDAAESLMGLRYNRTKRAKTAKLKRTNLSHAHVLVVDDIQTNLDVVKGLLRPYGLKVDCASSGWQAVDMIRTGSPRYNAVFMDHMMPGMNGIEAFRIIREEIGTDYAKKLPVIALTANAVAGNEEMFLKRGFQAFLSKPIDLRRLDTILLQWVRSKDMENGLPDVLPEEAANGQFSSNFAIEGIDLARVMESVGSSETALINILRSYSMDLRTMLREMTDYLETGNLPDYAVTVHGAKGASNIMFAFELGTVAGVLEAFAKAGKFEALKMGHPILVQVAEKLLERIETALNNNRTIMKPSADMPDHTLLKRLCYACDGFNMSEVDAVMEQLEAFQYKSGGELIELLREKVNSVAYEEISAEVAKWMK